MSSADPAPAPTAGVDASTAPATESGASGAVAALHVRLDNLAEQPEVVVLTELAPES